jgi:hypothetical protein
MGEYCYRTIVWRKLSDHFVIGSTMVIGLLCGESYRTPTAIIGRDQ